MRILHTMVRVTDLDKSVKFYTECLGMSEIKRKEYPQGKFTLVFLGYESEKDGPTIELTYNWGVESYELGNAFGHIAIEVGDIFAACAEVQAKGGKVVREPGPMKHGGEHNIAFVEDPDGYKIELIENKLDFTQFGQKPLVIANNA